MHGSSRRLPNLSSMHKLQTCTPAVSTSSAPVFCQHFFIQTTLALHSFECIVHTTSAYANTADPWGTQWDSHGPPTGLTCWPMGRPSVVRVFPTALQITLLVHGLPMCRPWVAHGSPIGRPLVSRWLIQLTHEVTDVSPMC